MNGTSEQADILPPNCMVKDRWKVVSPPATWFLLGGWNHHVVLSAWLVCWLCWLRWLGAQEPQEP